MDILNRIIAGMSKEQARFFKLYATRFSDGERKDLKLFDYIRKAGDRYGECSCRERCAPALPEGCSEASRAFPGIDSGSPAR